VIIFVVPVLKFDNFTNMTFEIRVRYSLFVISCSLKRIFQIPLQKTQHLLTWLLFTFLATLAISNVLHSHTLVMGPKNKKIKKYKNFSNVSL
jgi:hypothetical protein